VNRLGYKTAFAVDSYDPGSRRKEPVRFFALTTLALAAAVGLAACGGGGGSGAPSAAPLRTFQVGESEYNLTPSTFTPGKGGVYAFQAVNTGTVQHSLEIEGNGVKAKLGKNLSPGQSGTLKVDLKPGTYEIFCPIDGHKGLGMKGTITIGGGGSSPPPATTTNSTTSGGGYYR
jgi:plastocyanin